MSTRSGIAKRDAAGAARKGGGRRLRAVLLAGGLLLAGCRAPRADPDFRRTIPDANRELAERFRKGNLLGVADLYADHAVLIDPTGARLTGREEIDAHWSAIESPIEWRLAIRSLRGSERAAYQVGTSRMTTKAEGELRTETRNYLLVWRRDESGEWRVELDMTWPKSE